MSAPERRDILVGALHVALLLSLALCVVLLAGCMLEVLR